LVIFAASVIIVLSLEKVTDMQVHSRIVFALSVLLMIGLFGAGAVKADSMVLFTLTGPQNLDATFELSTNPVIDPSNADPGFGFLVTPIDLTINGVASNDFLAFYNTTNDAGGGFAAFSDDWNFDFSLFGEALYGGNELNPTFAPSDDAVSLTDENGVGGYTLTMTPVATPEPSSLLLLMTGLLPLGLLAKRLL
jgi:hypothetical protein